MCVGVLYYWAVLFEVSYLAALVTCVVRTSIGVGSEVLSQSYVDTGALLVPPL